MRSAALRFTRTALNVDMPLQYNPHVALALSDSLMVEVFQQRDGVLARNVGPGFEIGNGKAAALVRGQRLPDVGNHFRVKNQIGGNTNELAVLYAVIPEMPRAVLTSTAGSTSPDGRRRLKRRLAKSQFNLAL